MIIGGGRGGFAFLGGNAGVAGDSGRGGGPLFVPKFEPIYNNNIIKSLTVKK